MNELREALERAERAAGPADLPRDSHERFLRYRDRRRRNQRVAATVVAIAIVVAPISWFIATDLSGHTQTPIGPGPTLTDAPRPLGVVGLAAAKAAPSLPARGELVLRLLFGHTGGDPGRFSVNVYRDGRLIWERLAGGEDEHAIPYSTGLLEQRLTPEGVDLVREEVVSTGLVDDNLYLESALGLYFGQIEVSNGNRLVGVTWGDCCDPRSSTMARTIPTPAQVAALQQLDARFADPASWLPASAWEDPQIRAFVPSRYLVCFDAQRGIGLPRVLAVFPPDAGDMLRVWDRTRQELDGTGFAPPLQVWCSRVASTEARALARILDAAPLSQRHADTFGARYVFAQGIPDTTEISVTIEPLLPDQP